MHYVPLDGTHLVAVGGLIHQEVPTSGSASGARRSDAAMSDKDKQICLSTLPRTGFDAEVCSYLAFHSQIATPRVSADAKADRLTMQYGPKAEPDNG